MLGNTSTRSGFAHNGINALVLVLSMFLILSLSVSSAFAAADVSVTFPNGGEYWADTQTVTWTSDTDPALGWQINLYWNSGTESSTLVPYIAGTARSWDSFDTTGFSDGSDYFVEIVNRDDYIPTLSNTFIIDNTAPEVSTVSVAYPGTQAESKNIDEVTLTTTVSDSPAGISSVTIDASNIGGGASVTMYDDGSNGGDATADDNTYTAQITVSGTSGDDYQTVTATATDNAGNTNTNTGTV
ncbi:MAG: hypothetical protein GQ477_04650, partial [Nanohaloarchaea archaeon]|nr:hypothetical protein [Candidatus Nanohaloarchaea archaeon]